MKCINLLAALLLSILAFSCMIDPAEKKTQERQQQPQILQPAFVNPNTLSGGSGGSTAQQHYICPNGCSGSGGPAEGTCATCGTAYVHNAAFHNQTNSTPAQAPAFQPPNISVNDASTATAAAGGVFHYTCPNGCAGGSSTQGACATCGTALAHNQAFHTQTTPTTTTPVQTTISDTPTPNAAGQYHYTCPNGCAGGGNSAGTCASCGGALAHNQAYHQ